VHLDLKKLINKSVNYLNHTTLILFSTGLYLTISQPYIFVGKQNLFSQTIIPLYSLIIFINFLIIIYSNKIKEIKIIPNSEKDKSILLFILTTTLFSIINQPTNTIWLFSILIFFLNIQLSEKQTLKKTFYVSILSISILAIAQFILQSDLNLQLIGEPIISSSTKSIAKLSNQIIRPYGLFQHPNILAGIIVLSSYINPFKAIRFISPQLIALGLTFSLNGWLSYVSKHIKTIKQLILIFVPTLLIFIFLKSPDFITERLRQIISLIFSLEQMKPWEIQPIHNTFIFSAIQYGPIHLLSLIYLLFETHKINSKITISIIILMTFDHFFLTSFQALPILVTTLYLLEKPLEELDVLGK